MTSPISNTSGGMQAAGQRFVSTYGEIDGHMKSLKNELNSLRSQWDGSAAAIFENTMVQWGTEFDKILRDLDSMADRLIGGAGHVESAEDFAIQQGSFFK
ncbi:WXG100 family type VII secretion target [Micromonospora rubida]|uniref:WXG100 family type VII secretion target n=1 Tax=Micromonospora rubida TaxID=2697657 RepID=UPI0013782F49|nr:WXG100 family type VII secretion target [Micromonospora rubida]NBE83364.1 WXG100 family type VII secretion target [Micromonospora rubida]